MKKFIIFLASGQPFQKVVGENVKIIEGNICVTIGRLGMDDRIVAVVPQECLIIQETVETKANA